MHLPEPHLLHFAGPAPVRGLYPVLSGPATAGLGLGPAPVRDLYPVLSGPAAAGLGLGPGLAAAPVVQRAPTARGLGPAWRPKLGGSYLHGVSKRRGSPPD